MEQYGEFTVSQLKDRLRELGQPTAGSKSELIARLMNVDPMEKLLTDTPADKQEPTVAEYRGKCEQETEWMRREMEMARRERDMMQKELDIARREIEVIQRLQQLNVAAGSTQPATAGNTKKNKKYTKKNKKALRSCDLTDDDQSLLVEESNAEADSFSDDSEADFFANQRRKHERLIVSSEDEDTEDIDVLAGGDAASCSRVTTDNERTIDDDDTWYDNKENLFEFAFDDSKCGIQSNVDKYSSARDIFEQLFSRNIVETLVRCTNNYGKNLFETMRPVTRNASTFNFIETDEEELLKFLGLCLLQGKSDDIDKTPKTSSLVLRLMQQYLNKGHHLFMDNFYNSIELSKKLLEHKTHTTGTLRSNRKGNPEEVTSKKLNKGEHIWRRQGQIYVSKWRDKREVLSITTNHHPEIVEVTNKFGQKNKKPNDLAEYNLNMSGVDRYLCVWNSYFIYRQFHKSTTFLQFRDLLIQSLIALPDTEISGKSLAALTPIRGRPRQINSSPMASTSSTQQHFLEKIPLPVDFQRKTYFLRCRQCSANQIRKETSYRCKTCPKKPPLCPECFESYHL
ncbi:PiggyBac transposable element-derived protein 4 [Anthophora retusa]